MSATMRKRTLLAVGFLCSIFIVLGVSAFVEGHSSSGYALQAANTLLFGNGMLQDDSAALKNDATFMNEIGLPSGAYEVKHQERVNTIGYLIPQSLDGFYPQLFNALRVRGWEEIESNLVGTATFVKQDGVYTWLFVTCVDVADACSVVLQYQTKEE